MNMPIFTAEQVAEHASADSCWVILYGVVYDVTEFLPSHPGGARIILRLAGRDATREYDPVHAVGMLEDHLKPEARLGLVDGGGERDTVDTAHTLVPKVALHTLLNLDEVEAAAKSRISHRCWAYYFSAAADGLSKRANGQAYASILLRPRVLVDCSTVSTTTHLLGHAVGTPLYVAPVAMARLAHAHGEAGIARGITPFAAAQLVSNNASMTPEQVATAAAPDAVLGWQLYVQTDRARSEVMLARVGRLARFRFVVLTLDAVVPGKRELDEKAALATGPSSGAVAVGRRLSRGTAADLDWQTTLPWLRQHTRLPIVLKGLQTHEDAHLTACYARRNPGSVRAIILSNHGGRALDTAPPAVHTLLEIRKYCPHVLDAVEVWVDGGIRRGTDVVKALCLGAKAVGIGRAALWGLGAGGADGVQRTFEILQDEMETCMKLLGAPTVADLGPRFLNTRTVERDIFDGDAGIVTEGPNLSTTRPKL